MELSALEQKLGYVFKDQSLLAQALVILPSLGTAGMRAITSAWNILGTLL